MCTRKSSNEECSTANLKIFSLEDPNPQKFKTLKYVGHGFITYHSGEGDKLPIEFELNYKKETRIVENKQINVGQIWVFVHMTMKWLDMTFTSTLGKCFLKSFAIYPLSAIFYFLMYTFYCLLSFFHYPLCTIYHLPSTVYYLSSTVGSINENGM